MDFKFQQTFHRTMRASLEVTMSELFKNESLQHRFIERCLEDLQRHITEEVEQIMFGGELDKLIRDAIREEVKKQVAVTVEEKLVDFFGDEE